jgi:Sulfatase-modifying factor enzyme 1
MRAVIVGAVGLVLSQALFLEPVAAAGCASDSVQSGTVCIDKYESSVWYVPPSKPTLINKIQNGTISLANLTSASAMAAGVVQLGLAAGDLAAHGCPATGNGCVDYYAVSIPRVRPSVFVTWFQAAAAARNSLKRLPTNQEWQVAALGTPDTAFADDGSTTCNSDNLAPGLTLTGSRSNCISDVGALDMVGNAWEWVAEWVPLSTACPGWGTFSDDFMCLAGASEISGPGALRRGGIGSDPSVAGVFTVVSSRPQDVSSIIGFRCAR